MTNLTSNADMWMTRTTQNVVAGPFSKAQVCGKVLDGELKLQDEVCLANDYWFYLHESEEVKKFLGVEVPRQKKRDDDDTQTETETQTQTQPDTQSVPANSSIIHHPPQSAPQSAFQVTLQGASAAMNLEPVSGGKIAPGKSSPYSEHDEEERTEVQSLDIGKEIAARIDRSVVGGEPVTLHSAASPAQASSSAEVDSAAQDIGSAGSARQSRLLWIGLLLVGAAAAGVYLFVH